MTRGYDDTDLLAALERGMSLEEAAEAMGITTAEARRRERSARAAERAADDAGWMSAKALGEAHNLASVTVKKYYQTKRRIAGRVLEKREARHPYGNQKWEYRLIEPADTAPVEPVGEKVEPVESVADLERELAASRQRVADLEAEREKAREYVGGLEKRVALLGRQIGNAEAGHEDAAGEVAKLKARLEADAKAAAARIRAAEEEADAYAEREHAKSAQLRAHIVGLQARIAKLEAERDRLAEAKSHPVVDAPPSLERALGALEVVRIMLGADTLEAAALEHVAEMLGA